MIFGADVVNRLRIIMPGQESVTLGSRGATESGYTSVTYTNTRRCPATDDMLMMIGASTKEGYIVFEMYQTTESTDPKVGDKITDSESVVWQIKKIDIRMQQKVFRCLCLKNI